MTFQENVFGLRSSIIMNVNSPAGTWGGIASSSTNFKTDKPFYMIFTIPAATEYAPGPIMIGFTNKPLPATGYVVPAGGYTIGTTPPAAGDNFINNDSRMTATTDGAIIAGIYITGDLATKPPYMIQKQTSGAQRSKLAAYSPLPQAVDGKTTFGLMYSALSVYSEVGYTFFWYNGGLIKKAFYLDPDRSSGVQSLHPIIYFSSYLGTGGKLPIVNDLKIGYFTTIAGWSSSPSHFYQQHALMTTLLGGGEALPPPSITKRFVNVTPYSHKHKKSRKKAKTARKFSVKRLV